MVKEILSHLEIDPVDTKDRKRASCENLEAFNKRKKKNFSIVKNEQQDTLNEVETIVQSPTIGHTDLSKNPESAALKKNRRMGMLNSRMADDNDGLQSGQTDIISTQSLLDENDGIGKDDTTDIVQNEELEFSVQEESRCEEKRGKFVKRAFETKVQPISHEDHPDDSAYICETSSMQVAEKIEKFENELEQAEDRSFVHERAENTCLKRKLLILDINGLLADIIFPPPKDCSSDITVSRRAIFKRPFYYDFLKFCFERFDVGIWSSRSKKIIDRVVDFLLGDMKHKLLFCWDISYCTETEFKTLENKHKSLVFKELRKIWEKNDPGLPWEKGDYNESNTLLVDDSPYKALLNPRYSAIFPTTYSFNDSNDNSLGPGGDLRIYLERLASAENVQKYVEQNPFGQSSIDESSSSWDFYSKVLCSRSSVEISS